jgi:hypothetical protein
MPTKPADAKSPNAQVVAFCTTFARRPTPGLAVMLYGEWGCGKTWFLEHRLIPSIRGGKEGQPCLYVSLNGLATKDEIQAKIFQAIAAVAAEGKSGPGFIKAAIDKGSRLIAKTADSMDHWAVGGVKLLASMAAESAAKVYFDKERPVIVFDDFERCSVPDEELLGLLNHYVEHLSLPVIVVCNLVEKLRKADAQSGGGAAGGGFARVLEKVIGWQLAVKPEVESFLTHQVEEVRGPTTKAFLKPLIPLLMGMAEKLERVNLRSLRLALYHFASLDAVMVEAIGVEKAKKHGDGREQILRRVLAGTIYSRDKGTTCKDVLGLIQDRIHHSEREEDPAKLEEAKRTKYLIATFLDNMVTFNESPYAFVAGLIDEGIIDSDAITRLANMWTGYGVTETEKQVRYLSTDAYHRLEDKELNDLAGSVLKGLSSGEFRKPDLFRTLGRNTLTLAKMGYLDIDPTAVEKSVRQGVDVTEFEFDEKAFEDTDGRWGPATSADDQKILKMVREKMRKQIEGKAQRMARAKVADGPIAFVEWACDTKNPFMGRALFAYAEVEWFWRTTLALPNDEKCELESAFRMRFAYVDSHYKIDPAEVAWLKQSAKLLKQKMGASPKGVSGHLVHGFLETATKHSMKTARPSPGHAADEAEE